MKNLEATRALLKSASNGIITTGQVTAGGLHREGLRKLLDEGEIYRFSRGIYLRSDAWEDEFFLLQGKYGRGIYSHDTALYLWGYSDRTPSKYTMTFPKGYHAPSLKEEPVLARYAVPENYSLGISDIQSPGGNMIRIYDLERTLCDILRGSGSDIQIVNHAMKQYASSSQKDIYKLMHYARQLRVESKVLRYMEVLL